MNKCFFRKFYLSNLTVKNIVIKFEKNIELLIEIMKACQNEYAAVNVLLKVVATRTKK